MRVTSVCSVCVSVSAIEVLVEEGVRVFSVRSGCSSCSPVCSGTSGLAMNCELSNCSSKSYVRNRFAGDSELSSDSASTLKLFVVVRPITGTVEFGCDDVIASVVEAVVVVVVVVGVVAWVVVVVADVVGRFFIRTDSSLHGVVCCSESSVVDWF